MLSSMDFFQRSSSHLIPKSVADRTHGFLPQGTLHATRLIEKQLLLSAYTCHEQKEGREGKSNSVLERL